MNTVTLTASEAIGSLQRRTFGWLGAQLASFEDRLLACSLVTMVVLPIAESMLRSTLHLGIENVNAVVQHLTLVVGTLGAAIAAREKKLLSFAGAKLLGGRMALYASGLGRVVSISICLLLCYGALTFIQAERGAGLVLAYGIPVWAVALVIPAGFALIALRLLGDGTHGVVGNIATVFAACLLIAAAIHAPFTPETIRTALLVLLLVAALFGAPVFVAVGGLALILLWTEGVPLASLAVDHYSLVSNPTLAAIPLFTLTGYFLAESKAPTRLVELFEAWCGRIRGGPALATVLTCTFFTSVTGASGVTILALGGLLMPLLVNSGYGRKTALGMITAGGTPGVLLLPALPLILYAIVAHVSIERMFVGGLLPALMMAGIAIAWGISQQSARAAETAPPFDTARALRAVWTAKWELLLPVVLFAGLFSSKMTTLEAAALTAFYAFIVETVIHRDLSLRNDVPRVLVQCGLLVGGILLILGVAMGLTNYIVDSQISDRIVEWVTHSIDSPWVFLLSLNGFLLIVGCFVDIYSAIVVVAPLIVPIGLAYGIDPLHLGIIFLANLELGYLTPPVGMNLFFAASRFERPMIEICRSVAPLFVLFAAGVLIITYVPWLSTALAGSLR